MSMIQPMLAELEQEAETLKRHVEALPEDKLGWKPHEKSWTLGQLALHTVQMPGNIAEMLQLDGVPVPDFPPPPQPASRKELLNTLNTGLGKARELLGGMSDEKLMQEWKVLKGDQPVMAMPRVAVVRGIMLNHIYHHRGQLSVYLRLLDVPVPTTYGRSADENPLAGI